MEKDCPVCGVSYDADPARLRYGRQTTCSRRCSYIRRGAGMKREKDEIVCAVCGQHVERSPARVKGKYGAHFCSSACHYKGRSLGISKRVVTSPYIVTDAGRAAWVAGALKTRDKRIARDNYRHTDATKAKLSIATARTLAKGKGTRVSKLEGKVAAYIRAWGVPVVPQYAFRGTASRFAYVVDFWFPTFNVALEVNGTYWHADPRVYTILNATQRRCVAKYARKVEHLASIGARLVEVWELDLKHDIAQAMLVTHARLIAG